MSKNQSTRPHSKKFTSAKSRRGRRSQRAKARPPASQRPSWPPSQKERAGGFLDTLGRRVGLDQLDALQQRKHPAGRPAHLLSRGQLLAAVLFHYTVNLAGSLAEHVFLLFQITMAESTLSQRRQALPFSVFEELLRLTLRPLRPVCEQSRYKGLLLVALDGVRFSLANTEQTTGCQRGRNQKGATAFPKLQCAALIELVMHNPLAARLGWQGESEWKVAHGLLNHLPEKCLLLADRLYGCGAFLVRAMEALATGQGHFLVRVKQGLRVDQAIKKLADGSRIVQIHALDRQDRHRLSATLVVREIHATLQRPGFRPVTVRLWTSLLDAAQNPAQELVGLYMRRWEQELYFRELKRQLGVNDLLRSLTPETAAQEVAAMVVGSSLLAQERSHLQPEEEPCHRISFAKLSQILEPLWLTLLVGADLLTKKQKEELADRFYRLGARCVMQKKRARSCPRAMRQPIQPWPRKRNQKSSNEPVAISIATLPS
jgi:hypothetical protein